MFSTPNRYDYAPSMMRNSQSSPSTIRAWLGVEEQPSAARVRAGGAAYMTADGFVWTDEHYTGGMAAATTQPIAGTATPALYQTERWGSFEYDIPVPVGDYRLR